MSAPPDDRRMKKRLAPQDVEALMREIKRYRAQLDAIRKQPRPPKGPGGGRSAT